MQASTPRAVSPVIGVVLLVAITVVGASLVGVFALDLASSQSIDEPWDESEPAVEFSSIQNGDTLWLTHDGGDAIDASALEVRGAVADPGPWDTYGEVREGDRLEVTVSDPEGVVELVWISYDDESVIQAFDLGA